MTKKELLNEAIYVPSKIDKSIIVNLEMGNYILCCIKSAKELVWLKLVQGENKEPIETFSLCEDFELTYREVQDLKTCWYDIIPDDLPTLLEHFEHD